MKLAAEFLVLVFTLSHIDAQRPGFGGPGGFGPPRGFGPPGGFRGPRGPGNRGGERGGGGEQYLSEATRTCLRSCNTRNLACPVLSRERMTESCRTCLQTQCPREEGTPGFVAEQCHISKYVNCASAYSCPSYTSADQQYLSQCVRCRDGCLTPAMKADITDKMKKAKECRDKCTATHGCPTPPPRSCQDCIRRTCGDNRAVACMLSSFRSGRCPTCGSRNTQPNPTVMNKCRQCMDACRPDSGDSSGKGSGDGRRDRDNSVKMANRYLNFVRHLTKAEAMCLSSKCTGICPDVEGRISKSRNIPATCMSCLDAQCPMSANTPGFDRGDCHYNAYPTCEASNQCLAMSATERTEQWNCRTCRDGCLSQAAKTRIRGQMAAKDGGDVDHSSRERSGSGRRYGGGNDRAYLPAQSRTCIDTSCMGLCLRREAGPRRQSFPFCRQCINILCPDQPGVPNFDQTKCRDGAHTSCGAFFGCQPLDQSTITNRTLCRNCLDNCVPESVKAQVRNLMKQTMSCRDQCKKTSCSHRDSCMTCVKTVCEQSIYRNCEETAKSSTACPTCLSMDLKEQQCKSCMANCNPKTPAQVGTTQQVPNTQGAIPSSSTTTDQCDKTCESYGCPKKEDKSCQDCINSVCQNNAYADCENIVRTQSICPTCEKPSANQNQAFMDFCKQCYSTCAAKG